MKHGVTTEQKVHFSDGGQSFGLHWFIFIH